MLAIHVTLWSPPLPRVITHTPENSHMLHTHTHTRTRTHTHTQIIKCPTHNIPETIFKLLSVNKQTPTYSSDRIDADEYIDLVHPWMLSPVIFFFFSSCVPFCVFLMCDTNYVYKCYLTSIQIFPEHTMSALFVASYFLETVW